MPITPVAQGASPVKENTVGEKIEIASLKELCLNVIDQNKLWNEAALGRNLICESILNSCKAYFQLPCDWKFVSATFGFNCMDMPLKHPSESRVLARLKRHFNGFKEEVFDLFSKYNPEISIDHIKIIESSDLFLKALIDLIKQHPIIRDRWGDETDAKNLLLEIADYPPCWEAITVLRRAGAKTKDELESEEEIF